jgi:hypothetical protein
MLASSVPSPCVIADPFLGRALGFARDPQKLHAERHDTNRRAARLNETTSSARSPRAL